MATLSVSLYMLIFALLSALILIGLLLKPKPLYLKIVEEALDAEEETKLWLSKQTRESLKSEYHFIGKNVSIYFDKNKIIFERLGKKQKVIQKLVIENKDIIGAQKSYEGLTQTLHNGVMIYDNYYINVIFKNQNGEAEKIKMLFLIDKEDSSGNDKVDKIRTNAYVDVISDKINCIGEKNKKINKTIF